MTLEDHPDSGGIGNDTSPHFPFALDFISKNYMRNKLRVYEPIVQEKYDTAATMISQNRREERFPPARAAYYRLPI